MWHDEESDNPAGALKNLVYRLRNLMKNEWPNLDIICTGRGAYKWNTAIKVQTDYNQFEELCLRAKNTGDIDEKLQLFISACEIYKGEFLPKLTCEYWIASLSTYYHSMYLSTVKSAIELLEEKERYDEIARICGNVLRIDNLNESIHCSFVKALVRQGKYKLALEQYKKAVTILYENLGVSPSEELRLVYEEILRQTHEEEKSITNIQVELSEDAAVGAFLCEYGVFKKVYQLEKRRSERLGMSVYLSLIKVEPSIDIPADNPAYLTIINEGMERLETVLIRSLRAGDVISKYSGSQYIVMLPTCQYESAKLVMKRIEDAFYNYNGKRLKSRLQFSLGEMSFRAEK